MDASYKIQRGIHVHLIQFFMCPEFWVHIRDVLWVLRFFSHLFPHRDDIGKSSEEWCAIKGNMEQRACDLALYVIESRGTVRSAAKKFGISKSTVHKDLSERLPAFNRGLYLQVKQVLEENKAQRHIRGGLATRRKYKGE